MKFVISIVVLMLHMSHAMAYGKIFPTRLPSNPIPVTRRLIVKNVSDISEFSEFVHEEDDTRRLLELREGLRRLRKDIHPYSRLGVCAELHMLAFLVLNK